MASHRVTTQLLPGPPAVTFYGSRKDALDAAGAFLSANSGRGEVAGSITQRGEATVWKDSRIVGRVRVEKINALGKYETITGD